MFPNAGVGWAHPLPDVGLGYLNLDRAGRLADLMIRN